MPRTLPTAILATVLGAAAAHASFVTFESGQVRPLALSPDGGRLFAVNTPDNQLEIFDVGAAGLAHVASVPVGLEPVAVAVRTAGEVWVVNHLSDSVSVVDVAADPPRVARTLLVGDEPRDLVFAGPGGGRAFITTAHRGQQRTHPSLAGVPGAGDPQLTTPGIGRADVWVFDAAAPGAALGGVPLAIVTLFGDTPRGLAVSADGGTVYAAVFKSGNRSTVISEGAVCNGFAAAGPCSVGGVVVPGGLPAPAMNHAGQQAPETGLIVRADPATGAWLDPLGRDWTPAVRFSLPDLDVFALDAATLAQTAAWSGVGTTLFNLAVNPASGAVYVSNTEARNEVRFEGPGVFGASTVQGHLAEARITVLAGGTATPRHLNSHIDYAALPAPPGVKDASLATPTDMAVSADGDTLYVAAFGSGKIGVIDTAALESGAFNPLAASADYVTLAGGGPSGLVLDPARPRLYVLTRFDNTVSVVDLATRSETQRAPLHNPEPPAVVAGRPFLYDALRISSNGEASCSSCHIFGDMDDLAWDLGDPDGDVKTNPIPIKLAVTIPFSGILTSPLNGTGRPADFHPMKGPMTTQTLRGMLGSGAMHWRGDRANPPGTAASAFDEVISFNNFNPAFVGLVGRDAPLAPADMQRFTDFVLEIMLPPNPVRPLDNVLTPAQARGAAFFQGPRLSDGLAGEILGAPLGFTCEGCHRLQPALGHFGTDGQASFEAETQIVKIPHLRNLYQKVGMFGVLDGPGVLPLNLPHQGPQVRGFGFLHDGSVDTLFRFFNAVVFSDDSFGGPGVGFQTLAQRRDVEQFMLAFDSNLAPAVGQRVTLDAANGATVGPRLDLLVGQAAAGACDLTAKGVVDGEPRGWVRLADGRLQSDRAAEAPLAEGVVRTLALAAGQELTYTCVPPGSGERVGVDRDADGFFDADERDAGSDPADATSFPGSAAVGVPATRLVLSDRAPKKRRLSFKSVTVLQVPGAGSAGDPTASGGTLTVYNAAGATPDVVTLDLPAAGWKAVKGGWSFKRVDPDGAIRSVRVQGDRITVRGGGAAFGYTLDEPAQGRVALRLRLGATEGWCADAPAQQKGNPPSTAKTDRPGLFKGQPKTPAPPVCPPVPGGGSPGGAFLE